MSGPHGKDRFCRHFTPEYWVRKGFDRGWGDAAVMNWPLLEVLRRQEASRTEFVLLAPYGTRRPVVLYSDDPRAWGAY
jgi:hypothetical protein